MAVSSCKIRLHLNEDQHKTSSHTKKEGFLIRVDIKVDDKELLEWRTGIRFTTDDKVCFLHEVTCLSTYNRTTAKHCADPCAAHTKKMNSKLKVQIHF